MPKIAEIPEGESAATAFQNPAVLNALQSGLNSLVGMPSGYIASLPEEVKRRITALKNIQDENAALEKKFRDEVLELSKKYLSLHAPLYEKRGNIISGEYEPTEEECQREADSDEEIDEEEEEEEKKNETAKKDQTQPEEKKSTEPAKGIPEFWLTSLKNHPEVSEMITDQDEKALIHLKNLEYSYLPEGHGFKLTFTFAENEYFNNTTLTKTYHLSNSDDSGYDDVVFERAEGCEIKWKEGKNLTKKIESKVQRHKGTKKTRVVKTEVPVDSFFNFFDPLQAPSEEDMDDMEEQDYEEIEGSIQFDYEIGEVLKEKIIPNAINWFTGKALQYEDDFANGDDEEDFYDDDDEEDDDEDDDDDDDDDDAEGGAQLPPGQNPPECKQQ